MEKETEAERSILSKVTGLKKGLNFKAGNLTPELVILSIIPKLLININYKLMVTRGEIGGWVK